MARGLLQMLLLAWLAGARSQTGTAAALHVQKHGLAWLYHEGRVLRQTACEDKLTAIRIDDEHDGEGEDALGEGEQCWASESQVRLVVNQEQVGLKRGAGEEKTSSARGTAVLDA